MITDYYAKLPDLSYRNFREMIESVAENKGDNTAIIVKEGEGYRKWTHREFRRDIDRAAAWFLSNGFRKGDLVGILSENRYEWCVSWLAVVSAGLTVVPLDILSGAESLSALVRFCPLKGLCLSAQQMPKWEGFRKEARSLETVFAFDDFTGPEVVPFRDLLTFNGELSITGKDIDPKDTASIIFTSGTTGVPKGVMLSHIGILRNINASIMSLPIDERDNFAAVLPFHHTYPTTCSFLSPISVGGRVTIVDKMVGPSIIAHIRDNGGTIVIAVPLLLDKIARAMQVKFRDMKGFAGALVRTLLAVSGFASRKLRWRLGRSLLKGIRNKAGLGSIRLLVAGGGPLSPATARFFDAMGFNIVQGYGMSENGPLIATNTIRYNNYASVGLPVKLTDIRISEPNAEGIGEITVKSPSLMKGYYNNPEATAEMFTEEGYLKTGDLGRFDGKGFLYITGRIKNLIVSPAGKNIYPEEIEAAFAGSEVIGDILVLGKPVSSDNRGEEVMALCRPDFEKLEPVYGKEKLTEEFLAPLVRQEVERVNRLLEPHKRILHTVLRMEEFEKTSSQKIKRFVYKAP